jgi:hypothetical protein
LFNKLIHSKYGFSRSTWKFTEAGHGKGAADGVGAVVKRTAHSIVAKGTDIENAKDLFKHVGEKVSNVKLYFIDNASIESITFPNSLKSIKGTMGLHQIISFTTNEIFFECISLLNK